MLTEWRTSRFSTWLTIYYIRIAFPGNVFKLQLARTCVQAQILAFSQLTHLSCEKTWLCKVCISDRKLVPPTHQEEAKGETLKLRGPGCQTPLQRAGFRLAFSSSDVLQMRKRGVKKAELPLFCRTSLNSSLRVRVIKGMPAVIVTTADLGLLTQYPGVPL